MRLSPAAMLAPPLAVAVCGGSPPRPPPRRRGRHRDDPQPVPGRATSSGPIEATAGKTGLDALVAFGNANYATRADRRPDELPGAREAARRRDRRAPSRTSSASQEVATWRSGAVRRSAKIGAPTATTVDYDFLKTLRAELKRARRRTRSCARSRSPTSRARSSRARTARPGDRRPADHARRDPAGARAARSRSSRRGSASYKTPLEIARRAASTFSFIRGYDVGGREARQEALPLRQHPPRERRRRHPLAAGAGAA